MNGMESGKRDGRGRKSKEDGQPEVSYVMADIRGTAGTLATQFTTFAIQWDYIRRHKSSGVSKSFAK